MTQFCLHHLLLLLIVFTRNITPLEFGDDNSASSDDVPPPPSSDSSNSTIKADVRALSKQAKYRLKSVKFIYFSHLTLNHSTRNAELLREKDRLRKRRYVSLPQIIYNID